MRNPLRDWARRSEELLDDPRADADVVVASLRDIARINSLFGGAAAAAARVDEFLQALPAGTTDGLKVRRTTAEWTFGTGRVGTPLSVGARPGVCSWSWPP